MDFVWYSKNILHECMKAKLKFTDSVTTSPSKTEMCVSEEALLQLAHDARQLLELLLRLALARLVLTQQFPHLLLHLEHLPQSRWRRVGSQ